jgi:hypothetical protein
MAESANISAVNDWNWDRGQDRFVDMTLDSSLVLVSTCVMLFFSKNAFFRLPQRNSETLLTQKDRR